MKGPFERLKYEPRRLWECPECHHRERAGGDVTSRMCQCQRNVPPLKQRTMRMVEEGFRRVEPLRSPTVDGPADGENAAEPS